jgi:chemosensory pili system protein ChpA (sensor histidine kinase/response regulator)
VKQERPEEGAVGQFGNGHGAVASDVLIVDDDGPIRHLLCQLFRRAGVSAREARDGVEAVSAIEQARPRVMLLDLMMPRMNGWEVLEQLRARGMLDSLPVVVLTAASPQRTEGLSDFGVRAILRKPFEIQDLLKTVNGILEHDRPSQ